MRQVPLQSSDRSGDEPFKLYNISVIEDDQAMTMFSLKGVRHLNGSPSDSNLEEQSERKFAQPGMTQEAAIAIQKA